MGKRILMQMPCVVKKFPEGAHKKDKEYFNLHYVMMATRGLIVHRNQINYKTTN